MFFRLLNNKGVGTLIHYPVPPHLSKAYEELSLPKGAFSITEAIASSELSLPMGPHLSLHEAEYVVKMIEIFSFRLRLNPFILTGSKIWNMNTPNYHSLLFISIFGSMQACNCRLALDRCFV